MTPTEEPRRDPAAWMPASDVATIAGALHTASVTGLLDALAAGALSAAELAGATGTDPVGVALVLDVLVEPGIVARCGNEFALGPLAPGDVAERFAAVEHLVRTGQPIRHVDDPTIAAAEYPTVLRRIGGLVEPLAEQLATGELVPDLAGAQRVLDVAAGAAPFAIAFAHTGATVTAADLPGVVPTTRAVVAEAGVADAVTVIAGDLHELDLADRYDVVVLSGYCRLVSEERAADAIRCCARWLAPGGRLVVVDAVDTLDARRRGLARYALGLATRTASGRPYSFAAFGAWLAAAGLTDVDLVTTERPELSVISARLPEGASS